MLYAGCFFAGLVTGGIFIFAVHSRILAAIQAAHSGLNAQVNAAKTELKDELQILAGKM